MKMSAYRQQTPVFQLDHGACITGATTKQDVELIEMALSTEKPVLIGLDGQVTILKTAIPGDDVHTFEALYDNCITLFDLKRTREHGVKTPDEIPLSNFQVKLNVTIRFAELDIAVLLAGRNHGDLRRRLRDLLNEDPLFREQLTSKVADALMHQVADMVISVRDAQRLDEPHHEDRSLWEFP